MSNDGKLNVDFVTFSRFRYTTGHEGFLFDVIFLPLDEVVASRAIFVIVSGSDGRTGGRAGRTAFGAS